VNDVLDTSEPEVLVQRSSGFRVVNIEDLGPGARFADWVVNALYPINDRGPEHVSVGARFAPLRTEFADLPPKDIATTASRVLVTFGGTDPLDLTSRVARSLRMIPELALRVVVGPGAAPRDMPDGVEVVSTVRSMAAEMLRADIVVTSAGRTVYEAAATGTPVIVIAQNAREATHSHLGPDTGVIYLGVGPMVPDDRVVEAVRSLVPAADLRRELSERLRSGVDVRGAERIGDGVRQLLRGELWNT
jgi:spore coat polysaccharide biosynthesis predicted glycosyltransferase SpsG